jgi:pseudaminic acid synthase
MTTERPTAFEIQGRPIGLGARPFVIAEMSGNHNRSLDRALAIVDAAAKAGADAVKLQTYTADTMTLDVRDGEFVISNALDLWKGKTLYDLYRDAYTPWEWHEAIFARCRERGMLGFSSPFDNSAVDLLESLGAPCYKIASFELTHHPLIARVATTRKPLIMSTGMATIAEIDDAVNVARSNGCNDLVLLKCTSTYPAAPVDTNLRTIPHLRRLFGCEVGLSDHTMGIGAAIGAVSLGATVVEKHFTLSRADGGVDSAFSLEPQELAALTVETERAWQALGSISYGPSEPEMASRQYRRSLYIAKDLRAGEPLTHENLRIVRPGLGLHPKYYDSLLGARVVKDVKKGTPVSWPLIVHQDSK